MAADNQYTYPAGGVVYTTNTIGDLNITDQLPLKAYPDGNSLPEYPTATKTWATAQNAPGDTRTRFTRDVITTELPGADSVGENQGGNEWTNAQSSIAYTDTVYGEGR